MTKPTDLPAPADLSTDAKAEWKRIVAILKPRRLLTKLDIAALRIYATSYAQYNEAQKQIDQYGIVVTGTTGTPMKNPYCLVQEKSWDRIRVLLGEFGLTPSARAKMKTAEQPPEEEELEF